MSLRSMTGFCSRNFTLGGRSYSAEIRCFNHRHLELKIKLPRELSGLEPFVRSFIPTRITRGALEVKIEQPRETEASLPEITINHALAQAYFGKLRELQQTLGLLAPPSTMDIALLPDVLSRSNQELSPEEHTRDLEAGLKLAFTDLQTMQEKEGAFLAGKLLNLLETIHTKVAEIKIRRTECEKTLLDRIREKITLLFEAYPVSSQPLQSVLESRVSQELALLLERSDIREEVDRLESHIEHLHSLLEKGGVIGRKIDFLLQELNREINTLGNKAQDFKIQKEVIEIKVALEQVREQIQNIE